MKAKVISKPNVLLTGKKPVALKHKISKVLYNEIVEKYRKIDNPYIVVDDLEGVVIEYNNELYVYVKDDNQDRIIINPTVQDWDNMSERQKNEYK